MNKEQIISDIKSIIDNEFNYVLTRLFNERESDIEYDVEQAIEDAKSSISDYIEENL